MSIILETDLGHDPLVAAEYVNPFLKYVRATPYHTKGGWGAYHNEDSECQMVANIIYDEFWLRLMHFNAR